MKQEGWLWVLLPKDVDEMTVQSRPAVDADGEVN